MFQVLTIIFLLVDCIYGDGFVEVTSAVFGTENDGLLAAIGDFNGDKLPDVFLISDQGKAVDVLLSGAGKSPHVRHQLVQPAKTAGQITSVVPGDYNRDAQMDVLVTRQTGNQVGVEVYWGHTEGSDRETVKTAGSYTLPDSLTDEPLVMDANADMVPDLFGEDAEGKRYYWVSSGRGNAANFTKVSQTSDVQIRKTHSNAFLDLDEDLTADLYITTSNATFEIWLNQGGVLTYNHTLEPPRPGLSAQQMTQTAFADFDRNGVIDHLVGICKDAECTSNDLIVYTDKWIPLKIDFTYDGLSWRLLPSNITHGNISFPATLRVGDYNMDGYTDILVILHATARENQQRRVFVLENIPCQGNGCEFSRSFHLTTESAFEAIKNPLVATFYDLHEDGTLDVLISSVKADKTGTQLQAFANGHQVDACFISVYVLSGFCFKSCPNGQDAAYGVNVPGPTIHYYTTSPEGGSQRSVAPQLSQSAHFALQLPYVSFGLGQTPNFVDTLEVGIPRPAGSPTRTQKWTNVIPNSQLIIIPFPQDKPKSWKSQLYVTPSRLVLITAAALAGTCGFIAGIVGLLHWKEMREDKKEKRQDAHKFHFDAM